MWGNKYPKLELKLRIYIVTIVVIQRYTESLRQCGLSY
jgi:hypothetical protein